MVLQTLAKHEEILISAVKSCQAVSLSSLLCICNSMSGSCQTLINSPLHEQNNLILMDKYRNIIPGLNMLNIYDIRLQYNHT